MKIEDNNDLKKWSKDNFPNLNALAELEKWDRKHYKYNLFTNGHVQPGDGLLVELRGGVRRVTVCQEDLEDLVNRIYPSASEVILEALRRWYLDASMKWFKAIWVKGDDFDVPSGMVMEGINRGKWLYGVFKAKTEKEAINLIRSGYPTKTADIISLLELNIPIEENAHNILFYNRFVRGEDVAST